MMENSWSVGKDKSKLWNAVKLTFRITWKYAPKEFISISILTLILAIFPTTQAWLWRQLLNSAVAVTEGSTTSNFDEVLFWVFAGVIVTLFQIIFSQVNSYLNQILNLKLELNINTDTFAKACELDLSYFETPKFEDIINRASRNVGVHISRFITKIITITRVLLQSISISIFLITIDTFALFIIIPIAIPYLWYQWIEARARYRKNYLQTTRNRWLSFFTNCVMNYDFIPEVKINNLSPLLYQRYREILEEFNDENRDIFYKYGLIGNTIFEIIFSIGFYIILGYAGLRVLLGQLLIGDLVVYARTAGQLRSFMQSVSTSAATLVEEILYVTDWHEFMVAEPQLQLRGDAKLQSSQGKIEFRNVSFAYPQTSNKVLKNISFEINSGETVVIVGENGSGKSTIIKLLARFYDTSDGSIFIDDVDVTHIKLHNLHQHLAYVPQRFNRFESTVMENIAFGDWENLIDNPEKVKRVAEDLGISDFIEKMPNKYNTMLGRRFGVHDLSGGQWQKIAIARALARDANIIILDEPTSSLDAKSEHEIFTQFRKLAENRTTILVSHRFSTIAMADKIIVMNDGKISEVGTHEELIAKEGYYALMYNLQVEQLR